MTAGAVAGMSLPTPEGRQPLRDFVRETGLRSIVVGHSKDPNAKVTILLVSPREGRAQYAVKVATTPVAARAVEREAEVLADLSQLDLGDVAGTIPQLVRVVDFESRPAVVMTAVAGTAMATTYLGRRHTASAARVARDFDLVARWLAQFQNVTATEPAAVDPDGGVSVRLRRRFGGDEQLEHDLDELATVYGRLRSQATLRTAVHGDLWFGNVLLGGSEVSGVVDWEGGASSGEPIRDLVRFALMYSLYLDRRTKPGRAVRGHGGLRADGWGAGIIYALDGSGWYPELLRGFLRSGLERLGASPQLWRDALIAGIAEVAALTDDDAFARRHLELFRRVQKPYLRTA